MSDPYNRAYITAGNAYVAADGTALGSQPGATQTWYLQQYGQDSPIVYAQDYNRNLLGSGAAFATPGGVVAMSTALAQLGNLGYTGPKDAGSVGQAILTYGLFGSGPNAVMRQNCASCATGQNTGACAGCAPGSTPPGFVSTGSGVPISTTSGLPFGFKPGSPVSIVGITLPAWIWGAGLAAGYFALKSGRGRR